jgi:hypothetical protein
MRTTISLDDDLLNVTKHLAEQRRMSLSETVNFLLRRGLRPSASFKEKNGFPVFDLQDDGTRFGLEDVERAQNEEDTQHANFFRGR